MKKRQVKESDYFSVGEIAQRSGLAVSAIHFYEAKGFIKGHRNAGNQRRFHRGILRVLGYIKVGQKVGLTLDEIQDALKDLKNDGPPTPRDWVILGKKWEKILAEKINLLQSMKSQLGHCIGCGCLSLKECPLRNPDDILGTEGSGPRLILPD